MAPLKPDSPLLRRYLSLTHRYERMVWWMCMLRARGDDDLCADLVQEVWLSVWHRMGVLHREVPSDRERMWVRLVARTTLHNCMRRHSVDLQPMSEALLDTLADEPADHEGLLQELAAWLPDGDRRLMELRLEGYSNIEIAHRLGESPDAINQRMRRMVMRLRQNYEWLYNNKI